MDYLFACLPCVWRKRPDSECERLFPPPDTVITRPPRLAKLPHYGSVERTSSSSSNQQSPTTASAPYPKGWQSPGISEGSRERIGTISRAYQGRMRPLSRPASNPSSAAQTPHPTRTNFFEPHRPAAPNLGRSVSEPKSLAQLAGRAHPSLPDFAPHQLPIGHPTSVVWRGRPRSATAIDRLSTLDSSRESSISGPRRLLSDEGDRGRSPGPAHMSRSSSAGLLSDLATMEIAEVAEEAEVPAVVPRVTQLELGLRDLAGGSSIRRGGRGKSRLAKGRGRTS